MLEVTQGVTEILCCLAIVGTSLIGLIVVSLSPETGAVMFLYLLVTYLQPRNLAYI